MSEQPTSETIAAYVERMTRCYQKSGGGDPSEELVAVWRAIPKRLRDQEPAGAISRLVVDLAAAKGDADHWRQRVEILGIDNDQLMTDRDDLQAKLAEADAVMKATDDVTFSLDTEFNKAAFKRYEKLREAYDAKEDTIDV